MKKLTTKLKSLEGMMLRNSTAASFLPVDLFTTSAATGVWFDPSDLSTLFQDSAGTIPVTGMEQPVGLMLDKSKGLVRRPDLRDTGAPAAFGTPPSAATYNADGEGTASRTDGNNFSYVTFTGVTIGKSYEITVRNRGGSNLSVRTRSIGTVLFTVPAGATLTGRVVPADLGALSVAPDTNGSSISFTVLSVRELPGNHAIQATAASRPILTARKNLLLNTPLAGGTAGTVGAGAVAPTGWTFGAPTPSGVVSYGVDEIRFVAVAQRPVIRQTLPVVASGVYCLSGRVKTVHSGVCLVQDFLQWANVPVGAVVTYLRNGVAVPLPGVTAVAGGDVISAILTISVTGGNADACFGCGSSNSTTCDLTAQRPQVEVSGAPTRYQWVKTPTDYDYAGFPIGLRCDGVDDGMVTGNIDFTSTDKMFVCAGVRKLSDAATGALLELSSSSGANSGTFALFSPIGALPTYGIRVRGTAEATPSISGIPSPDSSVVSLLGYIADDVSVIRRNGVVGASSSSDLGTGKYGNYPLYLFRRGGAPLPFNGLFFGAVVAGTSYSATQVSDMELFMSARTVEL